MIDRHREFTKTAVSLQAGMVVHPRFRIRSAPADPHHVVVVPFHVATVVMAVAAPIAAMIAIPAAMVVPRATTVVAPTAIVATARSAGTAWTLLAAIRIVLGDHRCGGERGYGKTGRCQHVRDLHEGISRVRDADAPQHYAQPG